MESVVAGAGAVAITPRRAGGKGSGIDQIVTPNATPGMVVL